MKKHLFLIAISVGIIGLFGISNYDWIASSVSEAHIVIDMTPGQTTDPFIIRDSGNNVVFAIHPDGTTESTGEDVFISARNEDIDVGTEDVWASGGTRFEPTSASTVSVVSTSVNDDSVGTGVRLIHIYCLDATYTQFEENIIMDGTNPVISIGECIRVLRGHAHDWGTGAVADGTITVSHSGNVMVYIAPGNNESKLSHTTVPLGKTGTLKSIYGNSFGNQDVTIKYQFKDVGELGWVSYREMHVKDVHIHENEWSRTFPALTDFRIIATSDNVNADVSAGYELVLTDE